MKIISLIGTTLLSISVSGFKKSELFIANLHKDNFISFILNEYNEVKEVSYEKEAKKIEVKEDGTVDLSYLKREEYL